ncbi:LacI family DNA-binding transcriptional regulator [Pacificibacter marinus]|uniref:HTH-type transcriptional regulator GntR n=1 Tax=Pacificibacter marinus TaxID=658057 RepID=A0A1Y5TCH3_9RHOB|nr:LacI family DNA-binding transcriptional regulator [Pacificibacter marinus]SEL09129.1 transcriptional regulator, LacI family [Pacificibacter marinus]SLN58719.1 HTH-type transcriptional regulator GntR [Pacificibacter marinus]
MKRSPTMKDVAREAGVSVMTVSRAFKEDASVGKDTREKIRETADKLGYVFDVTAANLRNQRSDFIAVTIPSLNNANFAATVVSLTNKLSQAGYQVLLGHTNYDVVREEQLISQFLRRRPEAIIVTGGHHTDKARQLLANAGVPVIETWDNPKTPIGHVVGFSNADAMQLLVDHLVGQGRSRIAFLGGDSESDSRGQDRRRGFQEAMQGHGLKADRLIGSGAPQKPMQKGARAMATLLDQFPDTDAVICVSDLVGFGALSECQRRGITVPQQIAIAGFGAYDIAEVCVPTLTTVDPMPFKIGEASAELVLELLKTPELARNQMITPVLKVAQSTL